MAGLCRATREKGARGAEIFSPFPEDGGDGREGLGWWRPFVPQMTQAFSPWAPQDSLASCWNSSLHGLSKVFALKVHIEESGRRQGLRGLRAAPQLTDQGRAGMKLLRGSPRDKKAGDHTWGCSVGPHGQVQRAGAALRPALRQLVKAAIRHRTLPCKCFVNWEALSRCKGWAHSASTYQGPSMCQTLFWMLDLSGEQSSTPYC